MEGNAEDVLIRVAEAYRSFESYSDVGQMETLWQPGTDKERLSKLSFSTYFKRPNLFRFEWCDYSNEPRLPDRVNIIWSDGKHFYTKYCFNDKPHRVRDLSLMVGGAAGVSSGTAPAISTLLTDQIGGLKLTNLKAPGYVGSEVVEGEECHHLNDSFRGTHIWVSKPRSIVLRIDNDYVIEAGSNARKFKDDRFRSVGFFMLWLINSAIEVTRKKRDENLHVSHKTTYRDVITDSDIPDYIFSLAGPNVCDFK
jgi:hypothetical protein